MAQVRRLGPRVGGRLALFCIHRVNWVYGALEVTRNISNNSKIDSQHISIVDSLINCRIIIIIIIVLLSVFSVFVCLLRFTFIPIGLAI